MDNVALNSSEPTCDFRVVETQFSSFRGSQFFREHLGQRLPLEIHVRLGIAHRSIDIRIPKSPKARPQHTVQE